MPHASASLETRSEIMPELVSLGADIKALRELHKLTISQVSQRIDRSAGWLSEVERGMARPSIADLRNLASIFNIATSTFFGLYEETVQREEERGIIVRKESRRTLGNDQDGCREQLLSPIGSRELQIIRSDFLPNARLFTMAQRGRQEVAIMISGKLNIQLGQTQYIIEAGDTFTFSGSPHTCSNPYDEPAIVHWVITPSSY